MRRLRLDLEYEGTRYHGWQIQPNALTVQACVERALRTVLNESCRVVGAGRTDAGVHALGQVAHFETTRAIAAPALQRALNSLLPADIAVREVREVPETFHARKSAVRKRYVYWIWNDPRKSALWERFCWHVPVPLDLPAMSAAASHLAGRHDFSSFQASGCESRDNPVREIDLLRVEPLQGPFVRIAVEAASFLRHMVRNLVGTLVEVGLGRTGADEVRSILDARDRRRAGRTAPGRGLFLEWVCYERSLQDRPGGSDEALFPGIARPGPEPERPSGVRLGGVR